MRKPFIIGAILLGLSVCGIGYADLPMPKDPLWEPVLDEVYLQEVPTLIPTDRALTAVEIHKGNAWIGDANGVWRVDGDALVQEAGPNAAVTQLKSLNDVLYAAGAGGLWTLSSTTWLQVSDQPIADLCQHDGQIVVADYKTDRDDDAVAMSERYRDQLSVYARAVKQALELDSEPRSELWLLRSGVRVEITAAVPPGPTRPPSQGKLSF